MSSNDMETLFGTLRLEEIPNIDESPEAAQPIAVDGDVILDVSDDSRYLVSSQVLCGTSSVFRTMLGKDSKFAEAAALRRARLADSNEPIVVRLEDDDPWAMGVVMRVLHSRHYSIPSTVNLTQLGALAVVCDKYAFHEGLHTASSLWVQSLRSDELINQHPEHWLLISWVFGPEEIFTRVSRALVLSSAETDGELTISGNIEPIFRESIPSAVTAQILNRRHQCLTLMKAHVSKLQDSYFTAEVIAPMCRRGVRNHARGVPCDTLQLGHFYRTFHIGQHREWLAAHGTLQQIADGLRTVGSIYYTDNGGNNHAGCSWVPGLIQDVQNTIDSVAGLSFSEFPSRTWGPISHATL
ncbi:hypothetical protein FN846DRAFT_207494 [Sphaerosporella brunnea]|uniref:BTB domain-containing protein n=1 Tax=Sphaerosporella brunnea TaxID=1250544 RepID=A0A5J5EMT8_9PEZI|nr:hypothetical protein FN846DRAFT_207494 [Sphaerosporella brunnea]